MHFSFIDEKQTLAFG